MIERLQRHFEQYAREAQSLSPAGRTFYQELAARIYGIYQRFVRRLEQGRLPADVYPYARKARRSVAGRHPSFHSYRELLTWIAALDEKIPPTIDLFVAIPRSGLIPGSVLATKRGIPLTTVDSLAEEYWMSDSVGMDSIEEVLLVDDSVASGETMRRARSRIDGRYSRVWTAAAVVRPLKVDVVDYHGAQIEIPRLFEWNLMHAKPEVLVASLEGVLAERLPAESTTRSFHYGTWIHGASLENRPAFAVDHLVSLSPPEAREETRAWLAEHDIEYDELHFPDKGIPRESGERIARWKAELVHGVNADLAWESDRTTAELISRRSGVPTLCFDEMRLFD